LIYAVSKNVEIIFISNRYIWQIEDTFENLVKVGLSTNKNNFYFLESGWSKESRRQEVIKNMMLCSILGIICMILIKIGMGRLVKSVEN